MSNSQEGLDISLDSFEGGNLYAFDSTTDMADGASMDPIIYGSLAIEAHLNAPLTHPLNVIVYAKFHNLIQIDRARNIIIDLAPS